MKSKKLAELRRSDDLLEKAAFSNYTLFLDKLLRSVPFAFANTLHKKLRARDFKGLVEFSDSLVEQMCPTAAEHFAANQLAALIRKYPFPSSVVAFDKREQAIRKFKQAEHLCKRVNARFRAFNKRNPYNSKLVKAANWVGHVLGDFRLRDMYDQCGWGPGASVGIHGNATNMARKLLSQTWTVSPGAYFYARTAMSMDQHIFELLLEPESARPVCLDIEAFKNRFESRLCVVNYNKITFVPKTARVERTIAIEPLLNGFLQKGVDLFMRKRLKRVGINLEDQSRNQELARQGSLRDQTDPYVTIDLSSASDSLSLELVRYMLPPDWFDYLNAIRSRGFQMVGQAISTYHKFASMGNGFCFPLESLIFAALCSVAYDEHGLKHDFSVYGDDIIVRQSVATTLLELLRVCGFRVNRSKTFLQGPFRESCGADWYEGRDVRPITLAYAFDSVESIFKFCNVVRSKEVTATFFHEHLEFLEMLVPPSCRFVRPYKGDVSTALEVPLDVFMTSPFARWNREVLSWSWEEIVRSGVADPLVHRLQGYPVVVMKAALTGSTSNQPFTERRNTRTKIRRKTYSGASATWLWPLSNEVSGERIIRALALIRPR